MNDKRLCAITHTIRIHIFEVAMEFDQHGDMDALDPNDTRKGFFIDVC